jgi:hypothetical protein
MRLRGAEDEEGDASARKVGRPRRVSDLYIALPLVVLADSKGSRSTQTHA